MLKCFLILEIDSRLLSFLGNVVHKLTQKNDNSISYNMYLLVPNAFQTY